ISLQERGGMSFGESEVQERLKMSGNQKARVRSQVSEVFLKMRQMATASPIDRDAATRKAATLRKELAETIVGELSDEQKAIWNEMIGKPFTVKIPQEPAPAATSEKTSEKPATPQ
ncbi:MAG: hypothetical protein AB7I30_16575, partial [Isosphaeraceae bacterium]